MNPLDPTLRELNDHGCCAGTGAQTPRAIDNRPGLDAIAFRAGTLAQFKATMLAALAADDRPALEGLRTRENDDFSIALLDGWATVADVLTFYSERIANEGYLRTATERRSVLELARMIGHEIKPGVAASVALAFTIEDMSAIPGGPDHAEIPRGTKVQSLPGPNEKPQTYETVEPLPDARPEWNVLHAQSKAIVPPRFGQDDLYLQGANTGLRSGDALLIIGKERKDDRTSENWDFRRVKAIETFPDLGVKRAYSIVQLDRGLGRRAGPRLIDPAKIEVKVYALRRRANIFGHNAPDWRGVPKDVRDKYLNGVKDDGEWPKFSIFVPGTSDTIDLDAVYPQFMNGDWVAVFGPEGGDATSKPYGEVFSVKDVSERERTDFLLTGKTTRLKLEGEWEHLATKTKASGCVRATTVFCGMEELARAPAPFFDAVGGPQITLDARVPDLPHARSLLVRGALARVRVRRAGAHLELALDDGKTLPLTIDQKLTLLRVPQPQNDLAGNLKWELRAQDGRSGSVLATAEQIRYESSGPDAAPLYEIATVRTVETSPEGLTRINLAAPLRHAYDPGTVTVHANIAAATHGESVTEVLGGGDAGAAHQRFVLRQSPLTYTAAATETGGETTLEIWVNEVKWREVPTLHGAGPRDRVYVTRRADDGPVTVIFGDGENGARLPTGRENVRAVYRNGIGREGMVRREQLSLLTTRPLGVKGVSNPQSSSGAADPEPLADARRNAPRSVLTLGRVVSLRDYEDFAAGFGGIGKALAVWTWNVHARGVLLTLAGPDGAVLPEDGEPIASLLKALRELGNPLVQVQARSYRSVKFRLAGTVFAASDRSPEKVAADVKAALRDRLSFAARAFGQGVSLSEVEAAIQGVAGVDAVDVDALYRGPSSELKAYLAAEKPADGAAAGSAAAAELLTLDDAALADLKVSLG